MSRSRIESLPPEGPRLRQGWGPGGAREKQMGSLGKKDRFQIQKWPVVWEMGFISLKELVGKEGLTSSFVLRAFLEDKKCFFT